MDPAVSVGHQKVRNCLYLSPGLTQLLPSGSPDGLLSLLRRAYAILYERLWSFPTKKTK